MRVISGKLKNKKLYFEKNSKTRPLKDSVRENIFNILKHSKKTNISLRNSNVMDLYAGTGSFGIECLSRDASYVLFVEQDKNALINLKKNIDTTNMKNKTSISSLDVLKIFKIENYERKFDLVFLDPPYLNNTYLDIINILKEKKILKKIHLIIIHRDRNSNDKLRNYVNIIEKRVYGRSEIFFVSLL